MDYIILDLGSDVKGESDLKGVTGKIQCMSYSHGVSQPLSIDVSNNKRTVGRPSLQDFVLTKYFDASSPALNYRCCTAKTHTTATITVYQMDPKNDQPKEYITYTLSDVIISSVSVGGGGGIPTETLTLNFSKIVWKHVVQSEDGSQSGNISYEYDMSQATGASAK